MFVGVNSVTMGNGMFFFNKEEISIGYSMEKLLKVRGI